MEVAHRVDHLRREYTSLKREIWGDMGRYGEIWGDMGSLRRVSTPASGREDVSCRVFRAPREIELATRMRLPLLGLATSSPTVSSSTRLLSGRARSTSPPKASKSGTSAQSATRPPPVHRSTRQEAPFTATPHPATRPPANGWEACAATRRRERAAAAAGRRGASREVRVATCSHPPLCEEALFTGGAS